MAAAYHSMTGRGSNNSKAEPRYWLEKQKLRTIAAVFAEGGCGSLVAGVITNLQQTKTLAMSRAIGAIYAANSR
jgi:hypothetical protein